MFLLNWAPGWRLPARHWQSGRRGSPASCQRRSFWTCSSWRQRGARRPRIRRRRWKSIWGQRRSGSRGSWCRRTSSRRTALHSSETTFDKQHDTTEEARKRMIDKSLEITFEINIRIWQKWCSTTTEKMWMWYKCGRKGRDTFMTSTKLEDFLTPFLLCPTSYHW